LAHAGIVLTDQETVVDRGTCEIHWLVRVADAWVAAAKVTGASTEFENGPGPGVIWRRHTRLSLPEGTRLLCVERRPEELVRTPLEHLTKTRSSPRKTSRRLYSVGRAGQVVHEAAGTGAVSPTDSKSRGSR
jgi:hypothetical protein